jgi:succinate dehydrogenase/fumarate reductase flavoprotein subunit
VDEFDVVVLGTGAAGLTAAIRASAGEVTVGLFEKLDRIGGTAAWSGGMAWIPNNPHMAELGVADSREDALTYLKSLSHGTIDERAAETFVDRGPEVVRWLEANTPVKFFAMAGFPDYHPENPGAKPRGGRTMECPLFAFSELGDWAERVTKGPQLSGALTITETPLGRGAPDGIPAEELARRRVHDERGTGQALVGRLVKGCLDRGIEPRTGMRASRLVVEGARVVGVRFDSSGRPAEVRARRGVVIATGGFEWDASLVQSFLRGPLARPASPPHGNTGDGLRMAMRVGAGLGNMREAWWAPTIDVPMPDGSTASWLINGERTRPRCIMVNSRGQRFANEAVNYNAFGAAFHVVDVTTFEYVNHPAWMIFDDVYWRRYGLAGARADQPAPSWITTAGSAPELAGRIGVPADELERTLNRWNKNTALRQDPDFGRGTSAVDKWWGDPQFGEGPEATLGPLDTAPFYAVRVYSGCLGTKGGPKTDDQARVLDVDGEPIEGLYAAGNAMAASAMGMTYGGAGGTLGPAIVWGFLAGQHVAVHAPAGSS